MKRSLTRCWKLSRVCGRCLIWLVNGVLFLTAIIQGGLLWGLNQDTSFALPEWGRARLNQTLADAGLNLESASLSVDTSGWVRISDATFKRLDTGDTILRCPDLLVKVEFELFKPGNIDIQSIEGIGLSLPSPSYLTGQTGGEAMLHHLSFRLIKSGQWWQLQGLQAQAFGVCINASGSLGVFKGASSAATEGAASIPVRDQLSTGYLKLVQVMEQLRPWVSLATEPVINLSIEQTDPIERHVAVTASATAIHWQEHTLEGVEIKTAFTTNQNDIEALPVDLSIRGIKVGNLASARGLSLSLSDILPALKDKRAPDQVALALGSVRAMDEEVSGVVLNAQLDQMPVINAVVDTRLKGLPVSLRGSVDTVAKTAEIGVDAQLLLASITSRPELAEIPVEEWFRADQPLKLRATASLGKDWKPTGAEFDLTAESPELTGLRFTEIHLRGHTDFTQLQIDQADAVRPDYEVHGSFFQDFVTNDFRFLLKGSVLPQDLDPLLDAWWDKLWTYLHFTKPTVHADLDYNGRWGSLGVGMVFVGVEATDFSVYSLPLESCRLLVWRQLGFVSIQRIFAQHKLGNVSGGLAFVYQHLTGDDTMQTQLDVKTELPLAEIVKVVPEIEEIIPWFEMNAAPKLHTTGTLVDLDGKTVRRDLHVGASIAGDLEFMTVPLSNVALQAHLFDETIRIAPIRAGFENGNIEGTLFVHPYDVDHRRKMELSLIGDNVDYETGWAHLSRVLGDSPPPDVTPSAPVKPVPAESKPVASTKPMTTSLAATKGHGTVSRPVRQGETVPVAEAPHPVLGKLDATANLVGYFGDSSSFTGKGQVAIRDAQLKRIRMLGPLSHLFESIGISITTLDLRDAVTAFELTREKIEIPNLVVSGPNAKIKANGNILRSSDELGFDVTVYFLKSNDSSLKNLVGTLFSPLSYVLSLKLRGTLDDPTWRLAIDPRNLFGSSASESNSLPLPAPAAR